MNEQITSIIKNDVNINILHNPSKPIIIIDDNNKFNDFLELCKKISTNNKSFMCIDFEYNTNRYTKKRNLTTMQIMVIDDCNKYFDKQYQKPVYVLDPININVNNKKK